MGLADIVPAKPTWLERIGFMRISDMAEAGESCTEPEAEPPRWVVHFLARRVIEGDPQATATVFSIFSDSRPDDESASRCVQQTLREERAEGWHICTIWIGFFALRHEWNRRRREQ